MIDYFALFNEPRRPWLDGELLKAKFLQLSAEVHPDRVHGASAADKQRAHERSAELNAAYNCLREPKSRLQHLLELETGARPKQVEQISPGTMDLFMKIGQLCREADGFLAERSKVSSPLLKVQMFERAQAWTEKLTAMQTELSASREKLDGELKQMNASWETAPAGSARSRALPLAELERAWRDYSYLVRWSGQIQERLVQLSF